MSKITINLADIQEIEPLEYPQESSNNASSVLLGNSAEIKGEALSCFMVQLYAMETEARMEMLQYHSHFRQNTLSDSKNTEDSTQSRITALSNCIAAAAAIRNNAKPARKLSYGTVENVLTKQHVPEAEADAIHTEFLAAYKRQPHERSEVFKPSQAGRANARIRARRVQQSFPKLKEHQRVLNSLEAAEANALTLTGADAHNFFIDLFSQILEMQKDLATPVNTENKAKDCMVAHERAKTYRLQYLLTHAARKMIHEKYQQGGSEVPVVEYVNSEIVEKAVGDVRTEYYKLLSSEKTACAPSLRKNAPFTPLDSDWEALRTTLENTFDLFLSRKNERRFMR